jgi:hypothetical protein
VSIRSLSVDEQRDRAVIGRSNAELFADVPRMQGHLGGSVEWGAEGWTAAEVVRVAESWPDIRPSSLAMIYGAARLLKADGIADVGEVLAWTHALWEVGPNLRVAARASAKRQARNVGVGPNLPAAALIYAKAAGSSSVGRIAFEAGLAVTDLS